MKRGDIRWVIAVHCRETTGTSAYGGAIWIHAVGVKKRNKDINEGIQGDQGMKKKSTKAKRTTNTPKENG